MSERPTYNQISEQPMKHEGDYPVVLVDRENNTRISTARYEGKSPLDNGKYLVHVDGDVDKVKEITPDKLTDEYQQMLAERLAGKDLLGHEVGHTAIAATVEVAAYTPKTSETLSATIDQLLDGLTNEDKRSLHAYSRHMSDKRTAQRTGDGQFSMLSGQYAGQELRAMSPKAQQIADQYTSLMDRLAAARQREHAQS